MFLLSILVLLFSTNIKTLLNHDTFTQGGKWSLDFWKINKNEFLIKQKKCVWSKKLKKIENKIKYIFFLQIKIHLLKKQNWDIK